MVYDADGCIYLSYIRGKLIHPFCTHEGSGFGQSLKDLEKLCPQARITSSLSLYGSKVAQSEKEIEQWVQSKGE